MAVKRIAAGSTEKIEIGNTSVQKEFNFAGDIMQAVWVLVNQNQIYETVIGSGKAHSIQQWAATCFKLINKNPDDFIVENDAFTPEYKILYSDPTLIFSLGYTPQMDMPQLAKLMIKI